MTDNHFKTVYRKHAATYQEMISFEDVDANLPRALNQITAFNQGRVLDLGSGTGRLPMLFPQADFTCLDLHLAMLLENKRQREAINGSWSLLQGDGRQLPIASGSFNTITAGWAFGHFVGWYPETWITEINLVLKEIARVSAANAAIIILETMTTGGLKPAPPHQGLAAYYHHLETEHGFKRQVIATDYQFDNLEQACRYSEFFFGEDLSEKVRKNNWVRLPEWTGIWSKRL
jgi:ubiquinone/menaquinone biosynthesis C-methylase UbiE